MSSKKQSSKLSKNSSVEHQKSIPVFVPKGQSIGITFDYNEKSSALYVSEFSSDSAPFIAGVEIGMFIISVNNISLIGLSQLEIVNILKSKFFVDRNIVFSSIIPTNIISNESKVKYNVPQQSIKPQDSIKPPQQSTHKITEKENSKPPVARTIMKSSSSINDDPFSTPARRRRLIADIAKFLLKQYCVKACDNVYIFRKRTRASLTIQCAVRVMIAKRKLKELKFIKITNAAIIIQLLWRRFYSYKRLCYLREMHLLMLKTNLALMLQCRYRVIVAKRKFIIRKKEYEQMMYNRKIAAIKIQCNIRQYLAKKKVIYMRKQQQLYKNRLHTMAIKIQCARRQFIATNILHVLKKEKQLKENMSKRIALCWRYRMLQRKLMIIKIQRVYRGYVDRYKYKKMLELIKLTELEEKKRLNECQLMCIEDVISYSVRAVELSDIYATTISVNLYYNILQNLKVITSVMLTKWCIDQSLLYYCPSNGYNIGTVIKKIIYSTDNNLLQNEENEYHYGNDNNDGVYKIMLSEKEIENAKSEIPKPWECPCQWGLSHWWVDSNAAEMSHSLELNLDNNGNIRIRVRPDLSPFISKQSLYSGNIREEMLHLSKNYIILLTCDNSHMEKYLTENDNDTTSTADIYSNHNGIGFLFKNISIQVTVNNVIDDVKPPEDTVTNDIIQDEPFDDSIDSCADVMVVHDEKQEEEEIIKDDNNDISFESQHDIEDEEENLAPPVPEIVSARPTTAISTRPATATRRVVIISREEEERRALEALRFARRAELLRRNMTIKIQRYYRAYFSRQKIKYCAALLIQKVYTRSRTLRHWWKIVYIVCMKIRIVVPFCQKYWRGKKGRDRAMTVREDYILSNFNNSDFCKKYNNEILQESFWWCPSNNETNSVPNNTDLKIVDMFKIHNNSEVPLLTSISRREKIQNSKSVKTLEIVDSSEPMNDGKLLAILELPKAPHGCIDPSDVLVANSNISIEVTPPSMTAAKYIGNSGMKMNDNYGNVYIATSRHSHVQYKHNQAVNVEQISDIYQYILSNNDII